MTREDIDSALSGIVKAGTEDHGNGIKIISHLAILAEIVADQERRLRVLEPCPKGRLGSHLPHIWNPSDACEACGIVKGGGR